MLFKKTEIQYDIEHVLLEYETLFWHTTSEEWYESEGGGTQLCIQSYADRRNYVDGYIDSHPYTNGCGSMSRFPDREEQGYNQLNTVFKDTIFQDIVEGHFRARFMTMVMHSTYSVHQDKAPRLHLALDTHPNAYFFWPEHKEFVHIPADGFVYWVDTTKPHTFVNAGPDRTHLVMVE